MGSFIRLPVRALGRRIDAEYYRLEYVANAERLAVAPIGRREFQTLVTDGRRTLYFGTSTLDEDQAPDDWVPFLTADDLGEDGFFIETRSRRRVPPAFLAEYPAGRLRSGELLVKVKGPNQTAAYVDVAPTYPVLVSGTIWGGLVRKDVVDPHYLVAALSSRYAATARTRLRTNLNVEFLSADDLLTLTLPTPVRHAQRYIGDKVRQAERLRERARKLRSTAIVLIEGLIGGRFSEKEILTIPTAGLDQKLATPTGEDGAHEHSPVLAYRTSDVTPKRLDPWHYQSRFSRAYAAIRRSGTCAHMADIIDCSRGIRGGATPLGAQYPDSSSIQFYRTADVRDMMVHRDSAAFLTAKQHAELSRSQLDVGDILLTITGVYFGQSGVVSPHHLPGNISQHSVRFSIRGHDPYYVVGYLSSRYGQEMIWHEAYGATRPAIDYPGIEGILVRTPFLEVQCHIGDMIRTAERCTMAVNALTWSAKNFVERLIEGTISEADLVAAQKALESGDRSADRAILQSLRRGEAPDSPPLFTDMDAVYNLLDGEEDGGGHN